MSLLEPCGKDPKYPTKGCLCVFTLGIATMVLGRYIVFEYVEARKRVASPRHPRTQQILSLSPKFFVHAVFDGL